jgi:hypothetical protein
MGQLVAQTDSIYATVQGDTATIWHIQTHRNCGSRFYMDVQLSGYHLTVTEVDTGFIAFCTCYFDLSVTIGPLAPGNYTVDVFGTDTLYGIYWGSTTFTIPGGSLRDSVFIIDQDQSDCYQPGYNGPVWHVSPNGNNEYGNGSYYEPFATVQYAIDLADAGDTVLVYPGTYNESIDFNGKNITVLHWGYLYPLPENIDPTVILMGDTTGSVVSFHNGEGSEAVLKGFTITGGTSLYGGGIFIQDASPVIAENVITQNIAGMCAGAGAGIAIYGLAAPLIVRNTIYNNQAMGYCDCVCYFGGGIWIDSLANPIIGGALGQGNNIYGNSGDYGRQLYQLGAGTIIDARYNYFGGDCPPDSLWDVHPFTQFDLSGCSDTLLVLSTDGEPSLEPQTFVLYQNYPNPFNPNTTIRYDLHERAQVQLVIYDLLGRKVRTLVNDLQEPGFKTIVWDGKDEQGRVVGTGVYLYRIIAGTFTQTKKLVVLR